MDWFDILRQEFAKETDRAAVVLTASIIDELLKTVLSAKLVAVSSSQDELFDGPNAPLGTLSSRIEMAYRLGIISTKFTRDLHMIRKIRNDFAHNIQGCSFDDARVKARVGELNNSHGIFLRNPKEFRSGMSVRDQFLEGASWMVFHLSKLAEKIQSIESEQIEWGYNWVSDKEKDEIKKPPVLAKEAK